MAPYLIINKNRYNCKLCHVLIIIKLNRYLQREKKIVLSIRHVFNLMYYSIIFK